MKFYCFIVLFFVFNVQGFTQVGTIQKCKIIDSITFQQIDTANFFIIDRVDTIASGAVNDGSFSIKCDKYLNHQSSLLIIASNDYDTLTIAIDTGFCAFDTIHIFRLKPVASMIEGVEIITRAPLIKQDIDKITYNVSADSESKSLNLLELMPKLPFISLSPEDKPLFKGKSSFIILLNGKRSNLFSENNLRDALKAIPASTISNIEIITDPPQRYENDGYTGVINIVTIKNARRGYNGSVNLNTGTFISGANSLFNCMRNKFGVIVDGGLSWERTPYNTSSSQTNTNDFQITQSGENKINSFSKTGTILFSYEIDSLNLLNLDIGGYGNNLKYSSHNNANSESNNSNALHIYSFDLNREERGNQLSLSINYQKNFKKEKDRLLTFSYLLHNYNDVENVSNFLTAYENYDGYNSMQNVNNGQMENALQIDYVHPIKKVKIDAGAKYIYRNIYNDYTTSNVQPTTGEAFLDTLNTDNLKYRLSVFGLYNSYQVKLSAFSFRIGYRFESTRLNSNFKLGSEVIRQQYNNLLFSSKIQYKTNNNDICGISFRQQIQRPGIELLNPLIVINAPGFGTKGNPDLKPVLINNINLEFSSYKKISTAIALSYAFSKNTIQSITSVPNDTLILTSFGNIGHYNRLGFDYSTTIPVISKVDISIDGSLYYVLIKNRDDFNKYSNEGVEGFIYSYLTYRMKKFRFIGNVGFYGPTVNIQAKSNSYFYSSLGCSMQILKDNGNIALRLINPFKKYRVISSNINAYDLIQHNEQNNLFRGFYISFNYKFGKLDKEIKKNKRYLQIDDAARETGKIQ